MEMLSNLFEEYGDPELNVYVTKEARSYAFLNCDRYRNYSLGHNSFQDYFSAAGIVRWLIRQATGYQSGPTEYIPRPPLPANHELSDDQVIFTVGILQDEKILKALRIISTDANYSKVYADTILLLQKELSTDERPPLMRMNLFQIYLRMLRGKKDDQRPYLNGLRLQNTNLAGMNLSKCDFKGVDFAEAILSNTLFINSTLVGCSFFAATIDGADFTGADLAEANFIGIELPQTPPVFANVKNKDQVKATDRERRILF